MGADMTEPRSDTNTEYADLVPPLRAYLNDGPLGTCIAHPLLHIPMMRPDAVAAVNTLFAPIARAAAAAIRRRDWKQYLRLYRADPLAGLGLLRARISAVTSASLLRHCWDLDPVKDATRYAKFADMLNLTPATLRSHAMTLAERDERNNLDTRITLARSEGRGDGSPTPPWTVRDSACRSTGAVDSEASVERDDILLLWHTDIGAVVLIDPHAHSLKAVLRATASPFISQSGLGSRGLFQRQPAFSGHQVR